MVDWTRQKQTMGCVQQISWLFFTRECFDTCLCQWLDWSQFTCELVGKFCQWTVFYLGTFICLLSDVFLCFSSRDNSWTMVCSVVKNSKHRSRTFIYAWLFIYWIGWTIQYIYNYCMIFACSCALDWLHVFVIRFYCFICDMNYAVASSYLYIYWLIVYSINYTYIFACKQILCMFIS